MEKEKELEKKLQNKIEVIDLQIAVLDEYRREIIKLNKLLERKDQIILNLKNLINEQNDTERKNQR